MEAVTEVSFERAIELSEGTPRDLLLGNGFSIGAHKAFHYEHLLEASELTAEVEGIFATARTSNFEAVMRILLAEAQGLDQPKAQEALRKVEALKRSLVKSIHRVHPPRRTAISPSQWAACENFLAHFIGKKIGGRVFTTNYDLLLSWAIAPDRSRILREKRFHAYEGFRGGTYEHLLSASVIYLHGALHLYAMNKVERQFQWWSTGVALHDQIAEHLDQGHFPLIVTEGASSLKVPSEPGFLSDALRKFRSTCNSKHHKSLFILGHGLGPEDDHILKKIAEGSIRTVYLGGYGQNEMKAFHKIARHWVSVRAAANKPTLRVFIFDSTDRVWGSVENVAHREVA